MDQALVLELEYTFVAKMLWLLPLLNLVVVLMVLIFTCYGFFVKYVFSKATKLMPELPFPEGYWFGFGHVLQYAHVSQNPAVMWEQTTNFCLYYKEGFFGMLGHQLWLFIPDHKVIQAVLSSQDETEKNFVYQAFNCITDGIFLAKDYRWRRLRKRLNLTFSGKQIEAYMDVVNHRLETLLSIVRTLAIDNKYVDIRPYMARYFLDVMTKTHFGVDTNEQVNNEYKLTDVCANVLERLIEGRLLRPYLFIDALFERTQLFKEICKVRQKPFEFIEMIVQQRLQHVQQNHEIDNGLLVYLDLVKDALKELNVPVTIPNLQKNTGDLLVAGSDTTSVTASAVLYFLALNPDMQEKVYREVFAIIGQDSYRPLAKQDLTCMEYLEMVINEALRWSSPMGIIRELKGNYDAGKFVIPKGANLYCVMSSLHRNPDIFERPNDFYPEHFSYEAVKSRPKSAFLPFSAGPRNCPGKAFAYVMLKIVTARIICNYKVETDLPLSDVKFKMILMTQQVQGYPIRFIPRHS